MSPKRSDQQKVNQTEEIKELKRQLQIESSLESIRSASMEMQKSEDLHKVVKVVLDEIGMLEIVADQVIIGDQMEDKDNFHFWIAVEGREYPDKLKLPIPKDVFRKKRVPVFDKKSIRVIKWNKAEAHLIQRNFVNHYDHLLTDKSVKAALLNMPGLIQATKSGQHSWLMVGRYNDIPFSQEELNLFDRIGGVFDQSYARFLDLQKAEKQAREAQIEVALERVRARSMAMHNSTELSEVAMVLNKELRQLGYPELFEAGYIRWDLESKLQKGWLSDFEGKSMEPFQLPIKGDKILNERYNGWTNQTPLLYQKIGGKALIDHVSFCLPTVGSKQVKQQVEEHFSDPTHFYHSFFSEGALCVICQIPLTEEQKTLLIRFTTVFKQSFTRFLDLQKAEEQAREAKIEAALERIRAASLAMHDSKEISKVVSVSFKELQQLKIKADNCLIDVFDEKRTGLHLWAATPQQEYSRVFYVPTFKHKFFRNLAKAKKTDIALFDFTFNKSETRAWHNYLVHQTEIGGVINSRRKKLVLNASSLNGIEALQKSHGFIVYNFQEYEYSESERRTLLRISQVFEQAYKRFLDLQKAEEQAREAQIEAALERVRSRSLAMHKSDEILGVIKVVSQQMVDLRFDFDNVSFGIQKDDGGFDFWMKGIGDPTPFLLQIPPTDHPLMTNLIKARKRKENFITDVISVADNKVWVTKILNINQIPNITKEAITLMTKSSFITSTALQENTLLTLGNYRNVFYTKTQNEIIERFSKVFEQAYTRFLDLQKAEAQAREAQIEAALERVRASTMAMHNSEEVGKATNILFQELDGLGLNMLRCGIITISMDKTMTAWTTSTKDDDLISVSGRIDMTSHPLLRGAFKSWGKGDKFYQYELKGKDAENYYRALSNSPKYALPTDHIKKELHYGSLFLFKEGGLFVFSTNKITQADADVFHRFTNVFKLTYGRYNDLKKAEEQAREAQIEAALERVRAKAMSMHGPDDLVETIKTFYKEIIAFSSIPILRVGAGLLNKKNKIADLISVTSSPRKKAEAIRGKLNMEGHPMLNKVYKNWLDLKDFHTVIQGAQIDKYYQYLGSEVEVKNRSKKDKHFFYFPMFSEGSFYMVAEKDLPSDETEIFTRFTSALSLTYKRYKDLQDAEIREKEAIKQASLDRVRAEIASMRTTSDLERITPLVWKELTAMGVPFFRCGVFIIEEQNKMVHAHMSTPDGRALGALHVAFDDTGIPLMQPAIANWKSQSHYRDTWNKEEFIEMTKMLLSRGQIEDISAYQAGDKPPERLVLHLLPFKQGMLYVGNSDSLSNEQTDLVQALAGAFSVAYARYEDFVELENAKGKVENTLSELQSTQNQLVQSEKMASLGELTAGIAHEIQNPLNFVNNFSEVNKELAEELKEELAKGDLEEVQAIIQDIIDNQDKVAHHGKRAEGIVKSMLQHSRTSSGEKELTDLNQLADEYMRLSYHGYRAKDKSFNADFRLDLDENLPKINVVPQDIGRVLLNLINNAFQAVTLPARPAGGRQAQSDFKPKVIVSTKSIPLQGGVRGGSTGVQITVSDNGPGIPDDIKDKIFEPFFTTKPTGEGTGLGLSMSYDIVTKGHGGTIEVEDLDKTGITFKINIPIK